MNRIDVKNKPVIGVVASSDVTSAVNLGQIQNIQPNSLKENNAGHISVYANNGTLLEDITSSSH